jgi:hypothetical protein
MISREIVDISILRKPAQFRARKSGVKLRGLSHITAELFFRSKARHHSAVQKPIQVIFVGERPLVLAFVKSWPTETSFLPTL